MCQVIGLHFAQAVVAGLGGDGCLGQAGAARPLAHVEVLLQLLQHRLPARCLPSACCWLLVQLRPSAADRVLTGRCLNTSHRHPCALLTGPDAYWIHLQGMPCSSRQAVCRPLELQPLLGLPAAPVGPVQAGLTGLKPPRIRGKQGARCSHAQGQSGAATHCSPGPGSGLPHSCQGLQGQLMPVEAGSGGSQQPGASPGSSAAGEAGGSCSACSGPPGRCRGGAAAPASCPGSPRSPPPAQRAVSFTVQGCRVQGSLGPCGGCR